MCPTTDKCTKSVLLPTGFKSPARPTHFHFHLKTLEKLKIANTWIFRGNQPFLVIICLHTSLHLKLTVLAVDLVIDGIPGSSWFIFTLKLTFV